MHVHIVVQMYWKPTQMKDLHVIVKILCCTWIQDSILQMHFSLVYNKYNIISNIHFISVLTDF